MPFLYGRLRRATNYLVAFEIQVERKWTAWYYVTGDLIDRAVFEDRRTTSCWFSFPFGKPTLESPRDMGLICCATSFAGICRSSAESTESIRGPGQLGAARVRAQKSRSLLDQRFIMQALVSRGLYAFADGFCRPVWRRNELCCPGCFDVVHVEGP